MVLDTNEINFDSHDQEKLETLHAKIIIESNEVIRFRKKTIWIGRNSMQLFRGSIKKDKNQTVFEYRMSFGIFIIFTVPVLILNFQSNHHENFHGSTILITIPILIVVAAINFFS